MKVMTLGAFGFDPSMFRIILEENRPDLFIDVRQRRGVRGHEYAWVNSARLQALLAEIGIPYLHRPDLAPSDAVRKAEATAAASEGVGFRKRESLSDAFATAYTREVLDGFDAAAFIESLPGQPESIMLFCVEGRPEACHRSLLADHLAHDLGATVEHILPPEQSIADPGEQLLAPMRHNGSHTEMCP